MVGEPCRCGSGLPVRSCHAPRTSPSLRLEAFAWVHRLGRWFPSLRPRDAEFARFAEHVADELGHSEDDIPSVQIEEGLALLSELERARLVAAFAACHADRWEAVTADLGDEALARRALVAGVVRAAIGDRRAPPRRVLVDIDSGKAPAPHPRGALMLVLDPSTIWDIEAAQEASAEGLVPGRIKAVAISRLDEEHGRRVARLAGYLARHLPFDDVPRTTSLLEEACRLAEHDEAFASTVAIDSLVVYVAHRFAYTTSRN
jgi:hypothetical protein